MRDERSGLEYNGTTLNALFAQRRNLLRPSFLPHDARHPALQPRGAARCSRRRPRRSRSATTSREQRLLARVRRATTSCRWARRSGRADAQRMLDFPARFFVRFLAQPRHAERRTTARSGASMRGGSRATSKRLVAPLRHRVRLACARRRRARARPTACSCAPTARDGALRPRGPRLPQRPGAARCWRDPTPAEREVLGAIPYQDNDAVLHTDARLLPRRGALGRLELPRARPRADSASRGDLLHEHAAVARLRRSTFCVTLNRSARDRPARVHRAPDATHHPVLTPAGVAAQARHARDQRREPHLLLRRLLALRLPRGRRASARVDARAAPASNRR